MINIEELVVYLKVLSMKLNVITVGIFAYIYMSISFLKTIETNYIFYLQHDVYLIASTRVRDKANNQSNLSQPRILG